MLPLNLTQFEIFPFLSVHLDYSRISSINLTKSNLVILVNHLFCGLDTRTINKPWHPHPKTAKSKKYDYRIVSKTGIVLAVKKRAKYKGKNTRYVYDIMLDLTGAYFANLSLLEQLKVIHYLNDNFKLKCHRLDVAIDDYSRELFPMLQMAVAIDSGNYFGFTESNQEYLYCRSSGCIGTLYLGSRHSSHYVRVYTLHQFFDRWETELKRNEAQKLFDNLTVLGSSKPMIRIASKAIHQALLSAAIGKIDFRNKSQCNLAKNATRARSKRLSFWQGSLDKIFSSIDNQADINYLKDSADK